MKYRLYTEKPIPLSEIEGQGRSGILCDFESQISINKGDKIILDTDDKEIEFLNVHEVEVVKNPEHVIREGQITFSILTIKKID